jgi:predicted phosphodiesterase
LLWRPLLKLAGDQGIARRSTPSRIPPAHTVCTGDVVAYCADAAATVELVMASGIEVIAGNCEESLAAGSANCGCGFEEGTVCDALAREWYAHALSEIGPAHRSWMAGLPKQIVLEIGGRRLAVLHGAASAINRFLFASAPEAVLAAEIAATGCDGVIAGHCGIPFTRTVRGALWHNAGVIGMPANDGTTRTWFSLLTPEAGGLRVELRPLRYDHKQAAAALCRAGLTGGYGEALSNGIWPSWDVLPPAERAQSGVALEPESMVWDGGKA